MKNTSEFDAKAFDSDRIRQSLAQERNLEALRESYSGSSYPELPDMSSAALWDELAGHSDAPDFRLRRLRAVAEMITPGTHVLDIGVGWGEIIPMIRERAGCSYVGLDFSEEIITRLAAKFPECQFKVGDLSQISDSFDAVLALEVCEHILPSRILNFLRSIKSVLKDDGKLIISVPVYENLKVMTLKCPNCGQLHNRMGHVRAYTPELIKSELVLAGFRIERSFYIYASFERSFAGSIKRLIVDAGRHLFNLGKTLPLNIVLLARKT